MKVVIDIECNSLVRPSKIWCIVCKDIVSNTMYIYRNLMEDEDAKVSFLTLASNVETWIGHNWLEYDYPVLNRLLGLNIPSVAEHSIDTLILSRLVDYSRPGGHSIDNYGIYFSYPKLKFNDFTQWSQNLEDYCVRDVEICHKIYTSYLGIITDSKWRRSIRMEHSFQLVVNSLHNNGFSFDRRRADVLLNKVMEELGRLDKDILEQFPPKLKLVREVTPRLTKHGTLDRKDFRWIKDGNLSDYNGGPFCKCSWVSFNPSSHKQLVEVLNQAGWVPQDKTQTHKDLEYSRTGLTQQEIKDKLKILKVYGWKINENNLSTLPSSAPAPARTLAKRILLESRRRTLVEWLGLVQEDGRIHGKFVGLGAWTHRMAHQKPNLANIPNEYKEDGTKKLLGKELRSLWRAPQGRLLVGVDAEGIQFRIFAHYVNSPELTKALVDGRKDLKTDPHSLNKEILGNVCKTRQAAKRFIYALLLGAGLGKLGEILDCSRREAEEALGRILKRYPGFDYLRREVIPSDAKRGYFIGLDGRRVPLPGATVSERTHLCMSGYLQNGEAICMKMATLRWHDALKKEDSILCNLVHDEWQTEVPNDMALALRIAAIQADSLRAVGTELGLNCPLAGSYYNEDKKDYTIATNWSLTH